MLFRRWNVPEPATGASPKRSGCQCKAVPLEPRTCQGMRLRISCASQSTAGHADAQHLPRSARLGVQKCAGHLRFRHISGGGAFGLPKSPQRGTPRGMQAWVRCRIRQGEVTQGHARQVAAPARLEASRVGRALRVRCEDQPRPTGRPAPAGLTPMRRQCHRLQPVRRSRCRPRFAHRRTRRRCRFAPCVPSLRPLAMHRIGERRPVGQVAIPRSAPGRRAIGSGATGQQRGGLLEPEGFAADVRCERPHCATRRDGVVGQAQSFRRTPKRSRLVRFGRVPRRKAAVAPRRPNPARGPR